MGCQCAHPENSEDYLKKMMRLDCIKLLTYESFEKITKAMTEGTVTIDQISCAYISIGCYKKIVDYMLEKRGEQEKFQQETDESKTNSPVHIEVLRRIIEKNNLAAYRLCLFPIIQTTSTDTNRKTEVIFKYLKSIRITYALNKTAKIPKSPDMINYNQFCEAFLFYLSVCTSGYTTSLLEAMDKHTEDEESITIVKDLKLSLKEIYTLDNIKKYYTSITRQYVRQIELKNTSAWNVRLAEHMMTLDDFKGMMMQHPYLLSLCSLREHFIRTYEDVLSK